MNYPVRCATLLAAMLFAVVPAVGAATIWWVGGSGDWNTAGNWNTGVLPSPNDDVLIDTQGVITVTHASGTNAVKSIQCSENFVLSGGSLTVSNTFQVNNALTLSGGTLKRATVLQGASEL